MDDEVHKVCIAAPGKPYAPTLIIPFSARKRYNCEFSEQFSGCMLCFWIALREEKMKRREGKGRGGEIFNLFCVENSVGLSAFRWFWVCL